MSALKLSPVIAGTMKWGEWGARFTTNQYYELIVECIEAGATTFDHADIYGHYTVEEEFGKAIALNSSLRQKMQLVTKCGIKLVNAERLQQIKHYDTSATHIEASVERSLKNFRTDYLDLLMIHRPDPLMNPEEIAGVFTSLRSAGKVLHFGVSNFSTSQVSLISTYVPLSAIQVEISVMKLDAFKNGTLDQCLVGNMIPMAWSPLGGGKLFDPDNEQGERILAVCTLLTEKYKCTADRLLLAWLLKHPAGIRPVLGTAKAERIKAAMKAQTNQLTTEEWFLIWRASEGEEVP